MNRGVSIFHSGDDPADRDFAGRIASLTRSFSSPQLINVDELERVDDLGGKRPGRFRGVPLFILSPAMLRKPHYRQKLVAGAPGRNLPGRSIFCICRGVTTTEVRTRYDDMQPLFLDVMVGEEADLPELIIAIREYVEQAPESLSLSGRVVLLGQFLAAQAIHVVGVIGHCSYYAGFLVSPWVLYTILVGDGQRYLLAAACLASYATGYGINRVRPLDVWPWLGPAWRHGGWSAGGHPDSWCTSESLPEAVNSWQGMAKDARVLQTTALAWLGIPAAGGLLRSAQAWAGAAAFLAGLAIPPVWSAALRYFRRRAYWSLGMSDREMERTSRFFSPCGLGITTELEYQMQATQGGLLVRRRWRRRRPRVFISYAWRDEERTPAARSLHQTISQMDLACFLDSRRIPGKFAAWRARVVDEILDCTHLFVVLGPNVREAEVVHREIRTALQRWNTELEPAVICVVEPEVAAALGAQKLSPELKYLLRDAPKLSFAEATQSELVARLLRQRRRQGLWRDWLALLSPENRLRRFLNADLQEG